MDINSITVSGAYGRDYKAGEAARQDWDDGLDFFIHAIDGAPSPWSYCSCRDFDAGTEIRIRYNKKEDVEVFRV